MPNTLGEEAAVLVPLVHCVDVLECWRPRFDGWVDPVVTGRVAVTSNDDAVRPRGCRWLAVALPVSLLETVSLRSRTYIHYYTF